ncbi:hypothetical protein ACQPZP_08125 [Spirillospora sp. CA-142024]|uniref:hypothetical protein n=1 Tax=Spirillospora sp. CA-142024 TaxID=3240036 RepID=UPI003D8DE82B
MLESTGQNTPGAKLIEALSLADREWSTHALAAMEEAAGADTHLFVLLKKNDTRPQLYLNTPYGVLRLDDLYKVDRGLEAIVEPYRGQARHRRYLRPLCELSWWNRFMLVHYFAGYPIPRKLLDELRTSPLTRTLSWGELNGLNLLNGRFHQFGEEDLLAGEGRPREGNVCFDQFAVKDLLGREGRPREGTAWALFGQFAEVRSKLGRPVTAGERLSKATWVKPRALRRLLRLDSGSAIRQPEDQPRDRRGITLVTIEASGTTITGVSLKQA